MAQTNSPGRDDCRPFALQAACSSYLAFLNTGLRPVSPTEDPRSPKRLKRLTSDSEVTLRVDPEVTQKSIKSDQTVTESPFSESLLSHFWVDPRSHF